MVFGNGVKHIQAYFHLSAYIFIRKLGGVVTLMFDQLFLLQCAKFIFLLIIVPLKNGPDCSPNNKLCLLKIAHLTTCIQRLRLQRGRSRHNPNIKTVVNPELWGQIIIKKLAESYIEIEGAAAKVIF